MWGRRRSIEGATISLLLGLSILTPMVLVMGSGPIADRSVQGGIGNPWDSGPSAVGNAAAGAGITSGGPVTSSDPAGVISTINVGTDPGLAAYDSGNGYVYLANTGSHNMSLINALKLQATVSVGESPEFPTYDSTDGWIYVSDVDYHTIEALIGTTVEFLITVGANPQVSAYDSGNGDVYVPNQGSNNVSVVSGRTVLATVNVGTSPSFATYDSKNGYVYVGNSGASNVSILNGTTLVGTVNVGSNPSYATYDGGNGDVYVSNVFSNNVSVINGTTLVGTVSLGSTPESGAYDARNGFVYVPNVNPYSDSNYVSVISGTTLVSMVSVGSIPEFAAYDSGNGDVYVPNAGSNSVSVISGTSVIATITVGSDPVFATYDSGNGYVYVTNQGSGSVSVISGNVSGIGAASTVVFTETGIPSGTSWSVSLNGSQESSTGSAIAFTEVNGTYSYSVGDVPGWHQSTLPYNGRVAVRGSTVIEPTLAFTQLTYSVTFTETPLPSGTNWSVTMGGTPQASTTSTITFTDQNGTYGYTVASVSGYTSSPSSGSVTVAGEAKTVTVTFNALAPGTFAVTFTETGLPSGTDWLVSLNGTMESSTVSYIDFAEMNGTYSYIIGAVPGSVASPSAGNVTVNGESISISLVWTLLASITYNVTFTETGLGLSAEWSVSIDSTSYSASQTGDTGPNFAFDSSIVFQGVPDGSYNLSVAAPDYSATPSSGVVTVDGSNTSIFITFTVAGMDLVSFSETGLADGTAWSVTLVGVGIVQSTSATIAFTDLTQGTYAYTVGAIPGWTTASYSGSVTVTGVAPSVSVPWTPFTYSVTIEETGISAGTLWTSQVSEVVLPPQTVGSTSIGVNRVAIARGPTAHDGFAPVKMSWSANSTGPTAVYQLPNGTYSYVIAASGYQTTTPTPFTVNGQSETLPPVSVSLSSPSVGLSLWVYVIIVVVIAAVVVGVGIGLMRHRRPPALAVSRPPPKPPTNP